MYVLWIRITSNCFEETNLELKSQVIDLIPTKSFLSALRHVNRNAGEWKGCRWVTNSQHKVKTLCCFVFISASASYPRYLRPQLLKRATAAEKSRIRLSPAKFPRKILSSISSFLRSQRFWEERNFLGTVFEAEHLPGPQSLYKLVKCANWSSLFSSWVAFDFCPPHICITAGTFSQNGSINGRCVLKSPSDENLNLRKLRLLIHINGTCWHNIQRRLFISVRLSLSRKTLQKINYIRYPFKDCDLNFQSRWSAN